MDRLYLVHARARTLWGGAMYNLPSRFLGEIPPGLAEKKVLGGRPPAGGSWGGGRSGERLGCGRSGSGWDSSRPESGREAAGAGSVRDDQRGRRRAAGASAAPPAAALKRTLTSRS